jgi:hypothetical protein
MDLWGLYVSVLDIKIPGKENAKHKKPAELSDTDDIFSVSSEGSSEEIPSDEDETSASNTTIGKRSYRSDTQELKKYPTLLISSLFSYLAILILKLPICLSDIYSYLLGICKS